MYNKNYNRGGGNKAEKGGPGQQKGMGKFCF